MYNLYIPLCGLVLNLILFALYRWKVSDINKENKIYFGLLLDTFIMTTFCMIAVFLIYIDFNQDVIKLTNKVECFAIVNYFMNLFMYIIYTCKIKLKNQKLFYWLANLILLIVIFATPVTLELTNDLTYMVSTGVSVNITTVVSGILLIATFILAFKNKKFLKEKIIPIILLLVFIVAVVIIRSLVPEFICLEFLATIALLIMYFTLENPDIKMVEALNAAKDQAEKANQAKTDFLSSMSHEIRTPLNAIVGFSSCIEDAKTLDEAKENAKDVITASNTLLEIVNGILDISKIEAGKMEITNANYPAYDTFKELGKLMKPRATERGLDLQIHIAEDIPKTLYGDAANVKKVITNILSNAVKYTKKGYVKYDVSCVKNGDICRIIVSVEDTGRGIKPENIDKLFNKFERLDEDRNTTVEGTGLGLAITKQLVEMMGGKIIVQSVYGSGSKFTIILNQKIVSEGEKITVINENESGTVSLLGKRVLVVDDNMLNLKVAGKILEKYNPKELVNVSSGFDCIDKIKSGEQFDLILMDDMMPKMSGTETLAKLKEIPGFQTPVVALTANAINGMREKYLSAGFNDYLAKPIEKEPLEKLLATIFKSAPAPSSKPQEQDSLFGDLPASIYEVGSNDKLDIAQPADLRDDYDIPPVTENTKDLTNELIAAEEKKQNSTKQLMDARIDVAKGLELLGDIDTYNDTAKDYVSGLESRMNKMRELKDQKDMANYAVEVHSLKSDSKYLGCKELADIAFEEEVKSKSGDAEFITSDFARLEQEVNRVREILQKYLETIQ